MSKGIVRYKVKSEFADENKRQVQAVFTEFNDKKPAGLRYASFVGQDGVTFYHVASSEVDNNPLLETAEFKAFQKDIAERYEEIPEPVQVKGVGLFNFFD